MKEKKIRETLKKAQDALTQANQALSDVMQEMDDDEVSQINGAGNAYANIPRPDPQPIDPDVRGNG